MSERSYDVFLSYNSEDREAVEKIAVHLADRAGFKPWLDRWELVPGEPWFQNLERGLTSALTCAVFVGKSGEGPWQQREVAAALDRQVGNPGFRVIPVLLPYAPAKPDLPLFLAGNTWVAFRDVLDDEALWSLECGIAGRPCGRGRPRTAENRRNLRAEPPPHVDSASLVQPGGAMDVDSRFYVRRKADEEVFEAIDRPRGLVTVRGPRQTGKTSLILRAYVNGRRSDKRLRPVFLDFQSLPGKSFDSLGEIWRRIAVEINAQLEIGSWKQETWQTETVYDRNLTRFLELCIFVEDNTPILLCLDEVDRVFASPLRSDFFPTVRAFFNRGAWDAAWKNVRWLLSTSSEPSFFIENLSESPFNVGARVELGGFSAEETEDLARRHGLALGASVIDRIMDYVGGRPFLVHLMLYRMALHPESWEQLFDVQSAGGGVFQDHLRRYMAQLQREPELGKAMKGVVAGRGCDDVRLADRLEAAGLAKRDAAQIVICHCRLYEEYFRRVL